MTRKGIPIPSILKYKEELGCLRTCIHNYHTHSLQITKGQRYWSLTIGLMIYHLAIPRGLSCIKCEDFTFTLCMEVKDECTGKGRKTGIINIASYSLASLAEVIYTLLGVVKIL